MRTRSRAELGDELRRNQTRGVGGWRRCDALWAVLAAVLGLCTAAGSQTTRGSSSDDLPDAPSAQMNQSAGAEAQPKDSAAGEARAAAGGVTPTPLRRCKDRDYRMANMPLQGPPPCMPENPIQPFVTSEHVQPLTSHEKGVLAIRDFLDPFNLITIVGYSAIAIAENSHSQYGPGIPGVARLTGYGLAGDAQGEFLQTYAIPSLAHQDPRYHRMPTASVKRRIWHAVEHTYVSQHDDGRKMPNYATLLTYPISAELSDMYVPGLQKDLKSTAHRVAVGIATDPTGAIVAEFLPDVARHIRIHITFIQNIVDTIATGSPNVQ